MSRRAGAWAWLAAGLYFAIAAAGGFALGGFLALGCGVNSAWALAREADQ